MNIVHVIDYIDPNAGYEVNLLARLQAKWGHNVTIVTAEPDNVPTQQTSFFGTADLEERDRRLLETDKVRLIRVPSLFFFSSRAFFHPKIFKILKKLEPDIVFAHCLDSLTSILFILLYRFLSYPIVVDCHAVEMSSMNRFKNYFRFFYRHFVAPKIMKNEIPVIRLLDDDYVDQFLGVPVEYTTLLALGSDTDLFQPNLSSRDAFRKAHQIDQDDCVVLYAGKLDAYKGGILLAEVVKNKLTSPSGRELVFVIVGTTDGEYGRKVDAILAESENRIIRLPTQRYSDLPAIYQGADIAVFPKQCSLSFFDVQACGIPVLFEDNDVNRARTEHGGAITFKAGDALDFRAKILQLCEMSADQLNFMKTAGRKYVTDSYDFLPLARKYTKVLEDAAERFRVRRQRQQTTADDAAG